MQEGQELKDSPLVSRDLMRTPVVSQGQTWGHPQVALPPGVYLSGTGSLPSRNSSAGTRWNKVIAKRHSTGMSPGPSPLSRASREDRCEVGGVPAPRRREKNSVKKKHPQPLGMISGKVGGEEVSRFS